MKVLAVIGVAVALFLASLAVTRQTNCTSGGYGGDKCKTTYWINR